jgi:hypothetical protein
MRKIKRYYGDPDDADDPLDLGVDGYSEWEAHVQHPPNFERARGILISRLHALSNASTSQTRKVALCVLTMNTYPNLNLLKEWLNLAVNPQQQFMLFIHAKNQAGVAAAVQAAQLPIETIILGDVQTKWSSIGIVEGTWLMFEDARRNQCEGAILMSGDAIPIKNPNEFHDNVLASTVRGNLRTPSKYPRGLAVGTQWMSLNRRGLYDIVAQIPRDALYDSDFLNKHFVSLNKDRLTRSLEYEEDLRTAQIEDKYEGLAPDEVILQTHIWSRLRPGEKRIAESRISHMEDDESGHHANEISVDYLRMAPRTALTARKVTTSAAYAQVRRMWNF